MQSPQNTGHEQPSPGYGQPTYGQPLNQQPSYGQQGYGAYANSPIPSATGGYEAPRVGGHRVLKKINPGSAFKVGAITYALMWAIFGLLYIPMFGAMMAAIAERSGSAAAIGGGFGIGMYIFGIIASAIGGGIGAAIGAFVYNLVSGWVGGLEIEVS